MIFWDKNGVRIVKANERPFRYDTNAAKALLYNKNMGPIQLLGANEMVKQTTTTPILSAEATEELHRLVSPHISRPMNIPIMSAKPAKDQHWPMTSEVIRPAVGQLVGYARDNDGLRGHHAEVNTVYAGVNSTGRRINLSGRLLRK